MRAGTYDRTMTESSRPESSKHRHRDASPPVSGSEPLAPPASNGPSVPPPPSPPPGWHDDPNDPTSVRYWDGTAWTDQRAPRPNVGPPVAAQMTPVDPGAGNATASLVLGIVGVFTFWFFGVIPLLAFIFSMQSRTRSRAAGLNWSGKAIAGFVLGIVGLLAAAPVLLATL